MTMKKKKVEKEMNKMETAKKIKKKIKNENEKGVNRANRTWIC